MLFQGEEWAASTPFYYFAELESEELRLAVREGRRAEHAAAGWTAEPPDPTCPATRDASVLAWDERARPPHAEMLAWYRALITARRECPELRDPDPASIAVTESPGGLDIQRGPFTLRVNLSDAPAPPAGGTCVLASRPLADGALPPVSCALFHR
jgi:maltooligosyltrehalose trehalohydrolase